MGAGAFVSALLHGSVIALTLIAWPRLMPPTDLPEQVVPVEVLPPSAETNIMAQSKAEKPVEQPKPEPPPPTPPAAAEPPPPPEPDQLAMPEPTPPAPIPKEQPKPMPATPRFANLQPQHKPKPDKAKPEFDINKIDALVNKMAKAPAPTTTAAAEPTRPQAARSTTGVGAQTAMTMSEIDALRSQMMKCWNVPVGAPDPRALVLSLKVQLNQDGSVAGLPQLVETQGLSDPYFRAASESAIRAVKMCAPYNLPAEKYDTWSNVTVVFDPTKMAGF
jgi:outer membrane biosynthesis protein TonB